MAEDRSLSDALEKIFKQLAEKNETERSSRLIESNRLLGISQTNDPAANAPQMMSRKSSKTTLGTSQGRNASTSPIPKAGVARGSLPPLLGSQARSSRASPPPPGFWTEQIQLQYSKRRAKLQEREAITRLGILEEELDGYEHTLVGAWAGVRKARAEERKAKESAYYTEAERKNKEYRLMHRLWGEVRDGRNLIRAEYEAAFDELVCYCRASINAADQRAQNIVRTEEKARTEEQGKIAAEKAREQSRKVKLEEKMLEMLRIQERDDRSFITKLEATAASTINEVFKTKRKLLMENESRMQTFWMRHQKRQTQILHSIEWLIADEISARDRNAKAERQRFDIIQSSYPDSFKAALQSQMVRQRGEARERMEVEDACNKGRDAIEEAFRAALDATKVIEERDRAATQAVIDRALRLASRRQFADECAKRELIKMFEADNASWELIRFEFEEELDFEPVREEAFERNELAMQKAAEKAYILFLLRQRVNLANASFRARSEIEKECQEGYMAINDALQESQDRFLMQWYESIRRRIVEAEYEEACDIFIKHARTLSMSAQAFATSKKSQVEKPLSNSKSRFAVQLKKNTFPWFFGSDGIKFVEGATLRMSTSNTIPLIDVDELDVTVEILNPHEGDTLDYTPSLGARRNSYLPANYFQQVNQLQQQQSLATSSGGPRLGSSDSPKRTKTVGPPPALSVAKLGMSDDGKSGVYNPLNASTAVTRLDTDIFGEELSEPEPDLELNPGFSAFSDVQKRINIRRYTGDVRQLLDSITFRNIQQFSRLKIMPRIIRINFDNITVHVIVSVQPPIFSTPSVSVTTNIVVPLGNYMPPSTKEFKRLRCVVALSKDSADNTLTFKLPAAYFNHPKNGILMNGKYFMRLHTKTNALIDIEFDNSATTDVKPLLNAIKVHRKEGAHALRPLSLTMIITSKDESSIQIHQLLDVDNSKIEAPKLRVHSMDLSCRVSVADGPVTKAHDELADDVAFSLLSRASVQFPDLQTQFCGGLLSLKVLDDPDMNVNLGIRFIASEKYAFDVSEGVLWATEMRSGVRGERIAIGFAFEATFSSRSHDGEMMIKFKEDTFFGVEMIDPLLRAVGFLYKRGAPPLHGKDKGYRLNLRLDVRTDQQVEPIDATFHISVLPSVVDLKSDSFNYKERTGFKALPTMSIRPATYACTHEARILLEMLDGVDEDGSDEVTVMDAEPDPTNPKQLILRNAGAPIAAVLKHSKSKVEALLMTTETSWRRKAIDQPYPLEAFHNGEVPSNVVNMVLRSLAFQSTSNDAQFLKKVFRLVVDDGLTGTTTTLITVQIESVDDPTDIILSTPEVHYKQLSRGLLSGCPLMPGVRLEDVDSDNFHGGYISVEYTSGPSTELGDNLVILTPDQQEATIHKPEDTSIYSSLYVILGSASREDIMEAIESATAINQLNQSLRPTLSQSRISISGSPSGGARASVTDDLRPPSDNASFATIPTSPEKALPSVPFPYLSLVSEMAPQKTLIAKDNRLYYCGNPIGSLVNKRTQNGNVTTTTFLFRSESKFVSFPAAEYAMRCVGYENNNPKFMSGPRQYTVRLNCTGLKSTAETVTKVIVNASPSMIFLPTFASTVRFEGDKPKQLLKPAIVTLPEILANQGFLRLKVNNIDDPNDEIVLDETLSDVRVKEKAIQIGRETVASLVPLPVPKSNYFHMSFVKMNAESLEAILKSFCYSYKNSKDIQDLRSRQIEVEFAPSNDYNAICQFQVTVDMSRKDVPYAITTKNKKLVYLQGSNPIPLLRDCTVTDSKGKGFGSGWVLEVAMAAPAKANGEYFVMSTSGSSLTLQPNTNFVPPSRDQRRASVLNEIDAPLSLATPRSPHRGVAGLILADSACPDVSLATIGSTAVSTTLSSTTKSSSAAFYPASKGLLIMLEKSASQSEIKDIMSCIAYSNNAKFDKDSYKSINITLHKPRNAPTSPSAGSGVAAATSGVFMLPTDPSIIAATYSALVRLELSVRIIKPALDCSLSVPMIVFPWAESATGGDVSCASRCLSSV